MDVSKWFDIEKLGPKVLLPVALASGAVLFDIGGIMGAMQVRLPEAQRPYLAAIFLLSSGLLVAHALWWGGAKAAVSWKDRRRLRRMQANIHKLSPPEKAVLLRYLVNKTTTLTWDLSDGVVNGLEAGQYLYRSSQVSSGLLKFPFNVQPWVWDYIQEHPEALEGASGDHWQRERHPYD